MIMQTACGAEELPRSQAVLAWHAFLWAQDRAWQTQGATQKVSCYHRRGTVDPPGMAQFLARGHSRVPVPARTGFNDCLVERIRLQGESRATFHEALPPAIPAWVHYEGELRFTQGVRGLCTMMIDEVGRGSDATYSGYFCGHDASQLPLRSQTKP